MIGKLWIPYGNNNEYVNSYVTVDNMTTEQAQQWSNSNANITNGEVYATAVNNKAVGLAAGILGTIGVVVVSWIGKKIVVTCWNKFKDKKSKK